MMVRSPTQPSSIRMFIIFAMSSTLAAGVQAKTIEELISDAQRNQRGLGESSGKGPSGGLTGLWFSGEKKCVVTEHFGRSFEDGRRVDYPPGKQRDWEGGSIRIVDDGSGCQVLPDPSMAGLKGVVTSSCDGKHMRREYIQPEGDKGRYGRLWDFTLEGDKLVGTYTVFEEYHGTGSTVRCELVNNDKPHPPEREPR